MSVSDKKTAKNEARGFSESASHFARGLVEPVLRRIAVSRIAVRSGSAGALSVDQITLGRATIDKVNIQGLNASLDAGDSRLEGFRMVLRLTAGLRFRVFGIGRTRSVTFGFPFNVGTVNIPRLDNIALRVPTATVSGARAEVEPVRSLDLGGGEFSDLRMDGTLLPSAGFALAGMDIGAIKMRDLEVPATFTETMSIGTFTPNGPLRLPVTAVTDVRLPDVEVPRVSSSAPISVPDVRPDDLERSVGFDLIILSVRLFVRPVVDIQISALTINDIEAVSSIDRIGLENISAPVTISGLRLADVALREVTVNEIAI